jgi:hypothetical protein
LTRFGADSPKSERLGASTAPCYSGWDVIEAKECVVCGGPITRLRRALVAPFLARRIWNREPFCVELVRCGSCGFAFYNPRLEDAELQRLYANYRLEEYQRMRQATEPWYTPQFNVDLASPASYEKRRAALAPLLRQHLGGRTIRRLLDHGGDRGDLVAGLIDGAEAFVYDISGIPAAAGVTPVANPASCRADLIINSNVLEHVGFPRAIVTSILDAAGDGLVFLEVPLERPTGASRIARRVAQVGVMTVRHPELARWVLRPASLYMMHEHINYFTEGSLTTLFRACGGTVMASGVYASSGRAGRADMGWCLGARAVR